MINQLPGGRLITLDYFPNGRGKVSYSGYGFAFPECNASAKTTIPALTECLIHHQGTAYNLDSFYLRNQTHCKGSEVMGPCSWNSLIVPSSPPSWSSCLERMPIVAGLQDGLLKIHLQCQQVVKACSAGEDSPGGYICLKSACSNSAVSPVARIHKCKKQEVEMGVSPPPLTITPSNPTSKFLFIPPTTLCSASLEVIVQREEHFYQETQQWLHWIGI